MQRPNVLNVLTDPKKNIRYEVLAYRTLREDELVMAVRQVLSQSKKAPKRDSTVTIETLIGLLD